MAEPVPALGLGLVVSAMVGVYFCCFCSDLLLSPMIAVLPRGAGLARYGHHLTVSSSSFNDYDCCSVVVGCRWFLCQGEVQRPEK